MKATLFKFKNTKPTEDKKKSPEKKPGLSPLTDQVNEYPSRHMIYIIPGEKRRR